jgi:hypothetical protein
MSDVGRKRWWRASIAAVLGGGAALGGWAGLSRSAPPTPPPPASAEAAPAVVVKSAEDWRPPAPAPVPAIPAGEVVPAIPATPPLPAIPTIPVVPEVPAGGVTPASMPAVPVIPAVPAAPPDVPALPALPGSEPKKPVAPEAAPATPVLLPPSIDKGNPTPAPTAPPPSPVKAPLPGQPSDAATPDSRLQGPNPGNTVKTENPTTESVPVAPVAPPVKDSVIPVLPSVPAIGAPGEARGSTVERSKPGSLAGSGLNVTEATPGDPTVRILNESIAAAVVGGMLFAPASAAPPVPLTIPLPTKIDDKTDLADLKTKVESANTKLGEIQRDLKNLTELLNGRKDKDGFPIETSPGLIADLKKLTDRLAAVEAELGKMKGQTSLRPGSTASPAPGAVIDPRAGKGTVRVVNEYPVQISIVVNGTSYRVAPTRTMDVEVPAGEFTYQLLESGAASTKSVIKEKETVTLRIK